MFDIFEQIRSVIKTATVRIDSNVFVFHYRLTALTLIAFSLIVGTRKYFGDPIDCTVSVAGSSEENIVDNFCWFNSFIVVPRDPEGTYTEMDNGFRPVIHNYKLNDLEQPDFKYKPYFLHAYQWIEFILFFQACLFFLPRYLWRYCWEQGRVKALSEGFSKVSVKQDDDDDDKDKYLDVVRYIRRNKFSSVEYASKYILCEVLNFGNVLAQFFILKAIMGVNWKELVHDFFTSASNVNTESPLSLIFPNLVRCEVPWNAPAGLTTLYEYCVLPVNVFATKIYIFLWFHFAALSVITGISLIYRLATIFSSQFRCLMMKRSGKGVIGEDCERAIMKLGYSEWFLLSLIGKNMNPFSFKALIKTYGENMTESRPSFSILGSDKKFSENYGSLNNMSKDK